MDQKPCVLPCALKVLNSLVNLVQKYCTSLPVESESPTLMKLKRLSSRSIPPPPALSVGVIGVSDAVLKNVSSDSLDGGGCSLPPNSLVELLLVLKCIQAIIRVPGNSIRDVCIL